MILLTDLNKQLSTLSVEDLNITVGSGATTSSAADGAGLTFGDYTGKATFTWDDSESALVSNKTLKAVSIRSDANISIEGSNNELRFYEGSNYVGFEAGALSVDQIWVLPTADGSTAGDLTLTAADFEAAAIIDLPELGGSQRLADMGIPTFCLTQFGLTER